MHEKIVFERENEGGGSFETFIHKYGIPFTFSEPEFSGLIGNFSTTSNFFNIGNHIIIGAHMISLRIL